MLRRLILLIVAGSCLAQDSTIRVDVRQVLVPVVVTDKKGHHVGGLRASDFKIFEDGIEQQIASFSSDTTNSVDDIAALSKPASAAAPRHTYVICIDTLHASSSSAAHIRQALENLFEKEKATASQNDSQYVLIGIGRQLQVFEAATTSPIAVLLKLRSAAFQAAMSGLDATALTAQLQNIGRRIDEFCRRCTCGSRSGRCDSEIDSLKQNIDAEAQRWIAPTNALLEQFKAVVEQLSRLPTARTLILFSDGFNTDPKREFYSAVSTYLPQFKLADSKEVAPLLRDALEIASGRNVIIDAIDSRSAAPPSISSIGSMDSGPATDMLGTNRPARNTAPQATPIATTKPITLEPSASMEQLAQTTGGLYFREGGDLLKQFRTALTDGREYYLLAYVPKNDTRDGRFRSITVEVRNKKLNIRAKSGYWAAQ